ncbi:MAG TPA: nitroreductase family protein [Bacillota bacterium]|nr:nitroreductase family protein [Bacillota bacterium]
MELLTAMQNRRSIRKFKPDSVSDAQVRELLEAARLAPSGTNIQPWRFVVIKSVEARERLKVVTSLPFVFQAPVVLACCVDNQIFDTQLQRIRELQEAGAFEETPLEAEDPAEYVRKRQRDEAAAAAYLRLNLAIAVEHIALRAVDLGLGTCWVMMFDPSKARELLGLEDRYRVVALLPVGYPDQDPAPRPRLPLESLILKEF